MMGRGMMGQGMVGGGPGYMMGAWQGPGQGFDEETTAAFNQLHEKRLELNTLLSGPEIDEAKAKALQAEINTLHDKLAEKRLAAALEFRKNNPDAAKGYGFGPGARW
jgi:Spy/CpxP family protein refolding chaperone